MKKNSGFTIVELMAVLIIIGALLTLFIVQYNTSSISKSKLLFKKAYHATERTVYDIINDEDLYPSSGGNEGLKNISPVEYSDNTYNGASKFCGLFAAKLNTVDKNPNCSENHDFTKTPSFVTTDGIAWYMPVFDLNSATDGDPSEPAEYHILVDVDNTSGNNCEYQVIECNQETGLNTLNESCTEDTIICPDPDRFRIKVMYNGKMYVDGVKEKEYLQSSTTTKN